MNSKLLYVSVGVLALVAAVVLVTDGQESDQTAQDARLKSALLEQADQQLVTQIKVTSGGKDLELRAVDGGEWVLVEDQFPVNAERIATLLDSLVKVKHGRLVSNTNEALVELGLGDGVGTEISLGSADKPLLAIQLGVRRQGGGQYLRHLGETRAYLMDQAVNAVSDVTSWELKSLINLNKDAVGTVDFLPVEGSDRQAVTLSRTSAEQPLEVEGIAETEEVASTANQSLSVFSNLKFRERHDPSLETAKTAMLKADKVVVTMLDGRVYEGWVGSVGEDESAKHFFKVAALLEQGNWTEEQRAAGTRVNALMDRWAFEIPSHVATKLRRGRADLVKNKSS